MKLEKFNPKTQHHSYKEYGLLAKPLDKPIKFTKFSKKKLIKIKKENLGLGNYQRFHSQFRSGLINEKWDDSTGGFMSVHEIEYKGKFYYQVTDGQHRTCACPDDTIDAILKTEGIPAEEYTAKNDRTLVKTASDDDVFWANIDIYDTFCQKDQHQVKFVFNVFKSWGFTPARHRMKKTVGNFGTEVSKLHKFYNTEIVKNVHKVIAKLERIDSKENPTENEVRYFKQFGFLNCLSEDEVKSFTQEIFKDTMEIMFGLFGKTRFNGRKRYHQAWNGMMRYLMNSWDWNYSKEDLIQTLSKGRWCKWAKGAEKQDPLVDIDDWERAQKAYEKPINQNAKQWMQLFHDVYKVSSRS